MKEDCRRWIVLRKGIWQEVRTGAPLHCAELAVIVGFLIRHKVDVIMSFLRFLH